MGRIAHKLCNVLIINLTDQMAHITANICPIVVAGNIYSAAFRYGVTVDSAVFIGVKSTCWSPENKKVTNPAISSDKKFKSIFYSPFSVDSFFVFVYLVVKLLTCPISPITISGRLCHNHQPKTNHIKAPIIVSL